MALFLANTGSRGSFMKRMKLILCVGYRVYNMQGFCFDLSHLFLCEALQRAEEDVDCKVLFVM